MSRRFGSGVGMLVVPCRRGHAWWRGHVLLGHVGVAGRPVPVGPSLAGRVRHPDTDPARRAPVWLTVVVAIGFELIALWAIRDNLTLNVLMLVWPIDAIKAWQGAL